MIGPLSSFKTRTNLTSYFVCHFVSTKASGWALQILYTFLFYAVAVVTIITILHMFMMDLLANNQVGKVAMGGTPHKVPHHGHSPEMELPENQSKAVHDHISFFWLTFQGPCCTWSCFWKYVPQRCTLEFSLRWYPHPIHLIVTMVGYLRESITHVETWSHKVLICACGTIYYHNFDFWKPTIVFTYFEFFRLVQYWLVTMFSIQLQSLIYFEVWTLNWSAFQGPSYCTLLIG
mgnify:FL=1